MKKLYFLLPLIIYLVGCRNSKIISYSYRINTYTRDSSIRLLTTGRLISHGNYLFEFKLLTHFNETIIGGKSFERVYTDTIGVYLLESGNEIYYEFASFSLNEMIKKKGKLSEKESGVRKPGRLEKSLPNGVFFTNLKDTVINKIRCYRTSIASASETTSDSMRFSLLLLKKDKFNSLYRVFGSEFTDSRYCIVGTSLLNKGSNEGYFDEIESLRPLNYMEKRICENLILKSKRSKSNTN